MDHTQPSPVRDRVIAAATGLFLEKGYEGAGLAEIIARAGLSKGGFYHHFSSKLELFEAAVDRIYLCHPPAAAPDLNLRDTRRALEAGYDSAFPRSDADEGPAAARYYALMFDAIARLPGFRTRLGTRYRDLLDSLAARANKEHEIFPRVAQAHARNIVSALEGRLLLGAILNHPAAEPAEQEPRAAKEQGRARFPEGPGPA